VAFQLFSPTAVVKNIVSLDFLEVLQGGHDREPDKDARTLSRGQKYAPNSPPSGPSRGCVGALAEIALAPKKKWNPLDAALTSTLC
jgi:hypothetical protein